jgi:hypothetical protein
MMVWLSMSCMKRMARSASGGTGCRGMAAQSMAARSTALLIRHGRWYFNARTPPTS